MARIVRSLRYFIRRLIGTLQNGNNIFSLSTGNASSEASLDHICLFNDCSTLMTHSHPQWLTRLHRSFSSSFYLVDGFSVEFIAEFCIIGSREHGYAFSTIEFCTIECHQKWIPSGFICLLFMFTFNKHWANNWICLTAFKLGLSMSTFAFPLANIHVC